MATFQNDDPTKKIYLKMLRIFLNIFGLWPGEVLGEKYSLIIRICHLITPFMSVGTIIGQLYFIKYNHGTFSLILYGDVILALGLSNLTMFRIFLQYTKNYGNIFKKYIRDIHLIHFRHKQGLYENIYNTVEKASEIFTKLMILMGLGGLGLYNLVPIYNSYTYMNSSEQNYSLEFSVYWELPGYDQQERPFILTSIINVMLSCLCTGSVLATDLMLLLMVFQIIGHIKILEHNLKNLQYVDPTDLPQTSMNNFGFSHMFDHNTNLIIGNQLKSCVNHHRLIVSFADELSNFFGPTLAISYSFHLLGCCLGLFECSQGDPKALIRFGTLVLMIFAQLVLLSVIFEILLTTSENLPSALYSCPWERMNIQNRRLVSIMLLRMQTPIKVTAMGITEVGVQTMAGILKTTFSYFMFLKSKSVPE